METMELNVKRYTTGMQQILERQTQQEARNREDEEAYRVKKRTYDLLPNADENISKLQVGRLEEVQYTVLLGVVR